MKFVFFGKGERSLCCLRALLRAGYRPERIMSQPGGKAQWCKTLNEIADHDQIPMHAPQDPNSADVVRDLQSLAPDLFVLAGYGKILGKSLLDVPKQMSINLHGGQLPKYRGSSPMNWALINGETSFTLTIICVDKGVDTGDVLLERTLPIRVDDTICDLHQAANQQFPQMLLETMRHLENGTQIRRPQSDDGASYYPLRFPDDGSVIWDMLSAEQIHNRIRALTEPYPCAFTWLDGREVRLLSSRLCDNDFFGEPGRVYKVSPSGGLLVCAADKCLWIQDAVFVDNSRPVAESVQRYSRLATAGQAVAAWHAQRLPDARRDTAA